MEMYQHTTVTDMTDYESAFLDNHQQNTPYIYGEEDMCDNICNALGMMQQQTRRSNSRSGYRLFARVSNSLNRTSGMPGSTRMPSRDIVYAFFSQFGIVLDCYLPESATNVAYLCFDDEDTMEAILQIPEHMLCVDGVYVTLSRASPRPDYSMNNTDRVFVKNCPENVNRTDLRNYFSQFGLVTDVYIPKDKLTGEQKKFAFVTFANVDAAKAAISFGDTHRLIYVDRMTNCISTTPLQVMPAEARPTGSGGFMSAMNQQRSTFGNSSLLSRFNSFEDYRQYENETTYTTASSTYATNTPTGGKLGHNTVSTVEAAASVLISALSHLDSIDQFERAHTPQIEQDAGLFTNSIDDILQRLTSLSMGVPSNENVKPTDAHSSSTGSPQVIGESSILSATSILERAHSSDINIFEQFLLAPTEHADDANCQITTASWEQRE